MAKASKLKKVYIRPDGEETAHVSADAERLELRYQNDAKDVITIDLAKLSDEMRICSAWHGLSQKVGDTGVGKENTADDQFEEAAAVWERIMAGDWTKAREGAGPRISDLVVAIITVKTAAGHKTDEAEIKVKCADADYRKKAGANPHVAAEVAAIREKRMIEKRKQMQKAAKEAGAEGLADL